MSVVVAIEKITIAIAGSFMGVVYYEVLKHSSLLADATSAARWLMGSISK